MQETCETINQELFDNNTAQNLSYDEIMNLKKQGMKGRKRGHEIVEEIMDNSESYDKRSSFAKLKYIEKKKKK